MKKIDLEHARLFSEVGEVIKWLRNYYKITQKKLANDLNISEIRLCRIERSEVDINPDEIVAVAKYFNVPTDLILLNFSEGGLMEWESRKLELNQKLRKNYLN